MARGGHGDNLRDFAHPGQSVTLLKVVHQFIHPLAARGNIPSPTETSCSGRKRNAPAPFGSHDPHSRSKAWVPVWRGKTRCAASARIQPTPAPADALPRTAGRSCLFQAGLTASLLAFRYDCRYCFRLYPFR
jgi:hypothetical protein